MDERATIAQIAELRRQGKTASEIGAIVKLSADQVKRRWGAAALVQPDPVSTFDLPVRPVHITLKEAPAGRPTTSGAFTSLHYSDTHFPFADPQALSILYQLIEELQPDLIVDHGDLLDCTSISRFEKDPLHRVTLQDEIQMAAVHLARITDLAPHAERVFIEGNHEDRVRRLIWDMASDPKTREILRMPGVMAAMELPALLGMDGLGWEYVTGKRVLFDRLIVKHGNVVRKWSGQSAKEEWLKYGKSGMSGHVHRRGVFEHRDWNGVHAWWELGCMCDVNPAYMEDPDWQQGFAVVTWNEDRTAFGVEEVRVHSGRAMFRGRVYQAA